MTVGREECMFIFMQGKKHTRAHAALGYIPQRAAIDEVSGRINASQVGAFAENRRGQNSHRVFSNDCYPDVDALAPSLDISLFHNLPACLHSHFLYLASKLNWFPAQRSCCCFFVSPAPQHYSQCPVLLFWYSGSSPAATNSLYPVTDSLTNSLKTQVFYLLNTPCQ